MGAGFTLLLLALSLVVMVAALGVIHDCRRRSTPLLDRATQQRGARAFRYFTDVGDSSNA